MIQRVLVTGWSFASTFASRTPAPLAAAAAAYISPRESIIDVNFNLWRWRSRLIGERRLNEFGARRQSSEFAPGGFFTLQCITAPSVLDLILCVLFQTLGCRTSCCAEPQTKTCATAARPMCTIQYSVRLMGDQNKPAQKVAAPAMGLFSTRNIL